MDKVSWISSFLRFDIYILVTALDTLDILEICTILIFHCKGSLIVRIADSVKLLYRVYQ